MPKILVTGMSGTGESTALRELAALGHRTVDTDTDRWSRWTTGPDGSPDWVWREDAVAELLDGHRDGALYPRFDHVMLLSAPTEVLLAPDRRSHGQPVRPGPRRASRGPGRPGRRRAARHAGSTQPARSPRWSPN